MTTPRPWLAVGPLVLLALAVRGSAQVVVPPPEWARSVLMVDRHVPVFGQPREGARRRGTVAEGTRLPFVRRVPGDGCGRGTWVEITPSVFVCEDFVRYSPEAPAGVPQPIVHEGAILPHAYVFVRADGTLAYQSPDDYFAGAYAESLGRGFGLVSTGTRTIEGIPFVRLARGTWVTADAVRRARGSDFEGIALGPDEPLDLAWVRIPEARVLERPNGRTMRRAGRREVVHVARIEGAFAALADGTFVRVAELNRAVPSDPPEGVGEGERWIDVSIAEQVLVAYDGTRPIFATLVSTGAPSPDHETPLGTFRIWAKIATVDMDDLERTDVESNYLIEGVPWVQFFQGSNALHGAFWHDDFGRRRSHGCVNLSPKDARTLFSLTRPMLPPGFEAYLPDAEEHPTVVRIRP